MVGLARGGVPVAGEVARHLGAPLDVLVVRALGLPGQPELAMGAVAEGGVAVVNDEIVRLGGVSDAELAGALAAEERGLTSLVDSLRGGPEDRRRPDAALAVEGRTVVLVDDGAATGASARAAVTAVRRAGAAHVVVALAVAPAATLRELGRHADEVVCAHRPHEFVSVAADYEDFAPVTTAEVAATLALAPRAAPPTPEPAAPTGAPAGLLTSR